MAALLALGSTVWLRSTQVLSQHGLLCAHDSGRGEDTGRGIREVLQVIILGVEHNVGRVTGRMSRGAVQRLVARLLADVGVAGEHV